MDKVFWRRDSSPQTDQWCETTIRHGGESPSAWRNDEQRAFALMAFEPVHMEHQAPERRWHISISFPGRVPTWEEIRDSAHELRPGVYFCIAIPPRDRWLNVYSDVLHLWQIKDANLVAMWDEEGRARRDTPD